MGMNFPKLENLAAPSYSPPADEVEERGERRRVKRRKRKRQLPPEFYVGHAAGELDARGQESAGRMRKSQFPEEGNERRTRRRHVSDEESDDGESALAKCLPVVFGVLIPLIGGLFAALHFDIVKPENLRFWESKSPVSSPGDDLLARQVEQTDQALDAKAQEAYSAVQTTFTQFLEAETWEDAEKYLSWEQVPEDSEAPSFLKMFPRDAYRRAKVRLIDYARIPKTERFIFTTHLANGIDAMGEPLITFLIGEQQEEGNPKIHGLQLYQSWKATLKEFLETTGSTRDRFYVRLRTTSPKTTITFPDDGDYVKLELEDFLVKRPWSKEVYVRKDSYAGTRLLPTLTSEYSLAIVDLEWLKGPTGDVFVHVAGLHSSTWGDFHK